MFDVCLSDAGIVPSKAAVTQIPAEMPSPAGNGELRAAPGVAFATVASGTPRRAIVEAADHEGSF
jgi:hypothetical protein